MRPCLASTISRGQVGRPRRRSYLPARWRSPLKVRCEPSRECSGSKRREAAGLPPQRRRPARSPFDHGRSIGRLERAGEGVELVFAGPVVVAGRGHANIVDSVVPPGMLVVGNGPNTEHHDLKDKVSSHLLEATPFELLRQQRAWLAPTRRLAPCMRAPAEQASIPWPRGVRERTIGRIGVQASGPFRRGSNARPHSRPTCMGCANRRRFPVGLRTDRGVESPAMLKTIREAMRRLRRRACMSRARLSVSGEPQEFHVHGPPLACLKRDRSRGCADLPSGPG